MLESGNPMKMKPTWMLLALVAPLAAQGPPVKAAPGGVSAIALSPAVIMLKGQPGQSTTQTLTLANQTEAEFAFDLVAEDVIVKDGKRTFVAAGETKGSIAATAVFNPTSVIVKPHTSASAQVTVTVPAETDIRAVVAIFRGANKLPAAGAVAMTASLGSLLTFTLSDQFKVDGAPIEVAPQTNSKNVTFTQWLTNSGREPVVPEGVAAVTRENGSLVSKATFTPQRLLPGERLAYTAEFPSQLSPGKYRVVASFQFESKVITGAAEFGVD
jgi:hypothetical protein